LGRDEIISSAPCVADDGATLPDIPHLALVLGKRAHTQFQSADPLARIKGDFAPAQLGK
jgi:hypothetical protein